MGASNGKALGGEGMRLCPGTEKIQFACSLGKKKTNKKETPGMIERKINKATGATSDLF